VNYLTPPILVILAGARQAYSSAVCGKIRRRIPCPEKMLADYHAEFTNEAWLWVKPPQRIFGKFKADNWTFEFFWAIM